MKEFYIVSLNDLKIKQKLELTTDIKEIPFWNVQGLFSEKEVIDKINDLYPNGISRHGIQYMSEKFEFPKWNGKDYVHHIPMIEWTFELIRRVNFKELPSRFESVFGCETLEQARIFKIKRRNGSGNIYKVLAEKSFKADMNYLYLGPSILGNQVLAEKYWKSQATENPFWEILMTGDVEVKEKME
jgi:hypothetical protein